MSGAVQRDRADGLRGRRRHRGDDRRGVSRAAASVCRSAASASSASSAPRLRRSCCGITTRRASASSSPTTSACSRPVLIVIGVLSIAHLGSDGRTREAAGWRILRADALLARRHDADGDGVRPARHLPRARSAVARRLRAHGHPPRLGGRHRGGAEIFPARRVLRARSFSTASRSRTA